MEYIQDPLPFVCPTESNAEEPKHDSLDEIIQRNDRLAHYWLHQIVDLVRDEQPEQPRLD